MNNSIIRKTLYQTIIGLALSFIYMQFRPVDSYTLSWPFAAYGGLFLALGWFSYLRYDKLSIFKISDDMKKIDNENQTLNKPKLKTMIDYVNTPIQIDPSLTDAQKSKVKMFSNFATCIIFFILAAITM